MADVVAGVRDLVKYFRRGDGTPVAAVDGVSLDIEAGEFVVLLGPSGCGKTTLLRCLAGLEQPDAGTIEIHGAAAYDSPLRLNRPPERRRISMVFQSYALWPHMTAFGNIAYPLQSRSGGRGRRTKREIADRVRTVLELVGIPELAGQYPAQMSGGQQQRVALARALAPGDDLVLFDEPLSNVDAKVREQLRLELTAMQRELGFAAVYVTHDQVEAMELADRIAVMGEGRVAQLGAPREIYTRPRSRYVAGFVGTTNELAGEVVSVSESGAAVVRTECGEVTGVAGAEELAAGDAVVAVCRPERCRLATAEPEIANRWRCTVDAALFTGPQTEHVVSVDGVAFRSRSTDAWTLESGSTAWLSVDPSDLRVLPAG